MKLYLPKPSNRNFELAFAIVLRDYAGQFPLDELERIEMIPSKQFIQAHGLANFKASERRIRVRNGRHSIPEFINSLVHELTHLKQWHAGRDMKGSLIEIEAYEAGREAQRKYEVKGF